MPPRHFLKLDDLSPEELASLLRRAAELRRLHHAGQLHEPLRGKTLAMIFEKASTRTRVSFEAGMAQLGGSALFLAPQDSQLGRGEPVADTARVLSGMVDVVMIRTYAQDTVTEFARHASIPVINGLTDSHHPCQLLADLQTYQQHRGELRGRTVTWLGDGNNMCHSYIQAAQALDFQLNIACPGAYAPATQDLPPERVTLYEDPRQAVMGAHLVVTDVWASMGFEAESQERNAAFAPYQATPELMSLAYPDALFMHCLPAHRGEEVASEVIDGPQSVVWDEAENRLHAQKALLEYLLLPGATPTEVMS